MENKDGFLLDSTWYYCFGQAVTARSTSRA